MNTKIIREEMNKVIPIKDEEFDLFVEQTSVINLKKNEVWERDGLISKHMGFVNKGLLRQYYIKDGQEFTDCFFEERAFIGNYISYLTQEASNTITVALEACELLVMSFSEFQKIAAVMPNAEKFSKIVGDQKLFELNKRSASLLMDTPEERYYKFVKEKPSLLNRVPQYLIAQYLGIRPESLSRIRKRHIS